MVTVRGKKTSVKMPKGRAAKKKTAEATPQAGVNFTDHLIDAWISSDTVTFMDDRTANIIAKKVYRLPDGTKLVQDAAMTEEYADKITRHKGLTGGTMTDTERRQRILDSLNNMIVSRIEEKYRGKGTMFIPLLIPE